MIYLKWSGKFW